MDHWCHINNLPETEDYIVHSVHNNYPCPLLQILSSGGAKTEVFTPEVRKEVVPGETKTSLSFIIIIIIGRGRMDDDVGSNKERKVMVALNLSRGHGGSELLIGRDLDASYREARKQLGTGSIQLYFKGQAGCEPKISAAPQEV